MDKDLFKELKANLGEAIKYAKGEAAPESVYVVLSPTDIKAIREGLEMTQIVFAQTFQLNVATLRHWERGDRAPDQAAANFLRVIQGNPKAVKESLAATAASARQNSNNRPARRSRVA